MLPFNKLNTPSYHFTLGTYIIIKVMYPITSLKTKSGYHNHTYNVSLEFRYEFTYCLHQTLQ